MAFSGLPTKLTKSVSLAMLVWHDEIPESLRATCREDVPVLGRPTTKILDSSCDGASTAGGDASADRRSAQVAFGDGGIIGKEIILVAVAISIICAPPLI